MQEMRRRTDFFLSARRLWPARGVIAAVIVAILMTTSSRRVIQPSLRELLAQAEAAMPYRMFAARISGFSHRPLLSASRMRPMHDGSDPTALSVTALAAGILERRGTSPAVDDLHLTGLAYLAVGRARDAVETLARALQQQTRIPDTARAIHASSDAILVNDFAAACLANAEARSAYLDGI